MPEIDLLKFAAPVINSGNLEIGVKNDGQAPISEQLLIEFKILASLVDPRIGALIQKARTSSVPKRMASLAGIVTVEGGLSAWLYYYDSDDYVAMRFVNYLDQKTGKPLVPPAKIDTGAAMNIIIPLTQQGSRARSTLSYMYKYGERNAVNGSFDLTPDSGTGDYTPKVSFTLDQPNSTALEPASRVKLSWKIADGVSATIRGPLPGAHSKLTLSKNPKSDLRIDEGSLEIYAVGHAVYFLDAQVKPPRGRQNIQVIRTLIIDTKKVDQFASLRVRPDRVLPNGQIDIDWAVWGVQKAKLRIGEDKSFTLKLTEQDKLQTYQGTGTWRERIGDTSDKVYLRLVNSDFEEKKAEITVAKWKEVTPTPKFTGKPLGLAVIAPNMALLTTDGLWIAKVGKDDKTKIDPKFNKTSTDTPKAWLALGTFQDNFIVLQQTKIDGVQLARYNSDGKREGEPLDLDDFFMYLLHRPGTIFDLVGFRDRIYIVAERRLPGGTIRNAVMVNFDDFAWHSEPLLNRLENYRILAIGDGLYGLNRESGHMLRFVVEERDVEEAHRAASAASPGQSLVRTGLLVTVDDVLLVLNPDLPSSFKHSPQLRMTNVEDFTFEELDPESDIKQPPQDLIYNPQKNEWLPCGNGLQVGQGSVAALRGGDSERLWVIQPPDGGTNLSTRMHTLTDASSDLFAPDYVTTRNGEKFPAADLPPALNAKKIIEIRNDSDLHLTVMDIVLNSGLEGYSSAALVEVDPEPREPLGRGSKKRFEIKYYKTDPTPVRLRYMLTPTEPMLGYVFELTLSGLGLSTITSVFKRVRYASDGTVVINEIPGTLVNHPDTNPIVIPPPKRLSERFKLVTVNATRYDMARETPSPPVSVHISREDVLKLDTPTIVISPRNGSDYHRLGELRFDINFAMPHGIEVSSGSLSQEKLVRVNTDRARALEARLVKMLNPGDPPIEVDHLEGKVKVNAGDTVTYVCQIVATL